MNTMQPNTKSVFSTLLRSASTACAIAQLAYCLFSPTALAEKKSVHDMQALSASADVAEFHSGGEWTNRTLKATVIDSTTRQPLGGATLVMHHRRPAIVATGDANGRIEISYVGEHSVHVAASATGYPTQTFSLFEWREGSSPSVIALRKAAHVWGRVVDARGRGVPNQPVRAPKIHVQDGRVVGAVGTRAETVTDDNGRFDLPAVFPQKPFNRVIAGEWPNEDGHVDLALQPGDEKEVKIVIQRRIRNPVVKLTVKDNAGAPVPEVYIDMAFVAENRQGYSSSLERSRDGVYCMTYHDKIPGDLTVTAKGFLPVYVPNVQLISGRTTDVSIALQPSDARTKCRFVRSNGTPCSNMNMTLAAVGRNARFSGYTDCEGIATFSPIFPDSKYTVENRDIKLDQLIYAPGTGEVTTVVADPFSIIEFTAIISNTQTAIKKLPYIITKNPSVIPWHGKASKGGWNGKYTFIISGTGNYYLHFAPENCRPITIKREVKPDEDVNLGTIYFELGRKREGLLKRLYKRLLSKP